jgi:hypothetical protein
MSEEAIWWFVATDVARTPQLIALVAALTLAFGAVRCFFVGVLRVSGVVDENCTIKLVQQVIKACLPGDMPDSSKVRPLFYLLSRDKELLPSPLTGSTFRFEGMDFLNFGSPASIWPPPLSHGESCLASWNFDAEGLDRDGAANLLISLNVPYRAIFWAVKNQRPLPNSYTLRMVGRWTWVDFESMGIHFTYVPRCVVCGRADTPHELSICLLLATMNKVRVKEGYEQIVLTSEGEVVIKNMKLGVDVGQEMVDMRSSMKLLMAHIEKLKAAARERGGSSKRKADALAEEPPTAKKVKAEGKGSGKAKGKKTKGST